MTPSQARSARVALVTGGSRGIGRETAFAQAAASSPFGRLGTPADIAEVAAFLAGPGRWVNGQVIYANGGVA